MELQTDRLILRPPAPEDFPAFKAYFMSERAQFTGGSPDPILAWNRFCITLGHRIMRGYGVHIIVNRATGQPIGAAGPFFPEGWPEPEIAWQIWTAEAEGKGYAYEAVLAARAHAADALGWAQPASLIAPDNLRSQTLAQRLGCQQERDFFHPHFGTLQIWRHPAP
ncbi:GNAT family N-acetyltransferase [Roseinatronobacter bogoriensis]|uniref:N-acetyltransferase n=1 Tax=Roseinatronobacter bogoriensis subsp. barguzinensis TaxID=441209 RepID=A0A2K8K9R7_9RHOB|nr:MULTISPECIES: GNAT family N-acetyltransferase [Rhodobaca]ATX65696.1 N-acetyltransferase [Rhodobaca barguzinensis]MBB4208359.1 RimJ/RimL family protein N-acetyltransferase [Rhodobaca bogoriensis DSM 18756]TDW39000.1 RimJ/RimL family protein N-acetyltransferase [Rhodobaca barguzinensis]TDY68817.1 RimJ/RimL family protein N-acetyltransferase [Rhodobaca bogoriensis DSM 18756]